MPMQHSLRILCIIKDILVDYSVDFFGICDKVVL